MNLLMNTQHMTLGLLLCLAISATAFGQGTRLLRHPTVSRELVTFAYAGDLWAVSRSGGEARRLTSTSGVETDPYFSPDGSQIAYTATVAGNTDVYVVPTAGGDPKRLTYHPGVDRVRGWTPDGRRVVLASARTSAPQQAYFRLWTLGLEGGLPEPLPMPRAFKGAYSPDGQRIAYEEFSTAFIPGWYGCLRNRRNRIISRQLAVGSGQPLECGGKRSATPLSMFSDVEQQAHPKRRRRFALPAHCYVNVKRQFSLEGFSFCSNDGFLFFFNLRD